MECDSLSRGSPGWGSEPSLELFWRGKGKGCADERVDVNVKKMLHKIEDVPRLVETQANRGLPLLGGRERFLKRASSLSRAISCSRKSSCARPKRGSSGGISNSSKGISWRRMGCSSEEINDQQKEENKGEDKRLTLVDLEDA
jgi:hypothetical protein